MACLLFQLDCLEAAGLVERGAPDLFGGGVFRAAEIQRHAKAEIEIAGCLQRIDQPFGVELRSDALQPVDQDVGCDEALQRRVVGRFAGKYFASAFLYSSTALE